MTYEERLAPAVGRDKTKEQDEAVTSLVREHAAFVYRVAYSILRDSHDAEDVAQETFVRVLKNIRKLPAVRDHRAWLARIAWRLALTKWKSTRRKRDREIDAAEPAVLPAVESAEALALIERMTSSLPEHLRHALMLSVIDEMSNRDVAAVLNISEGTVRSRIHRARKLLKEKFRSWL